MLSIALIKSLAYYESLASEDYYHQGQEPPGQWHGGLALQFGLTTPAAGEAYQRIFAGYDPRNGKALVQGVGPNHRHGWDFCWSAPKSVSSVWSQADPLLRLQIEQVQARAVAAARIYIQDQLITRRGKAGCQAEKPQSYIWADFEHSTSRAQDPQLHTHSLLANICQRSDGTYGTIEPSDAFRAKLAGGAVYRAELAHGLKKLGFSIERDAECFRIHGDSSLRKLEREFSKRREAIEAAMAERGVTSARGAEIAALNTRESKQFRCRPDLFQEWQQVGASYGYQLEAVLEAKAPALPLEKNLDETLLELTYHQSTFHVRDLYRIVAVSSQGRRGATGIHDRVQELLQSPEIIRLHGPDGSIRYTTHEMITIEQGISDCAVRRRFENCHPVSKKAIREATSIYSLSDEQLSAFAHVVQKPGGIACIQGVAGSGKSFLLGACREAWQRDGYEVIGAALAGKAAEGLEGGSGIPCQTLHSLCAELEQGKRQLSARTVVVIDEASMVGSRQMGKFLQMAENATAKVVLVGDTRQLQAVEAGAPFRIVQEKVSAAELQEIRRQKQAWAVQAVRDFAAGKSTEGLARYQDRGLLFVGDDRRQAMDQLVTDWWKDWDAKNPGESLMITSTRADSVHLNNLARAQMMAVGNLGATVRLNRDDGFSFEVAEGDRVIFKKNSKMLGVKNGHLATIQSITASPLGEGVRIHARLDNGKQVTFDSMKYDNLAHGYAITTHSAQGLTVNRSYVLGSETMMSQELAYVQMSRHRDESRIYLSKDKDNTEIEIINEAARKMGISRQAESTTDYNKISTIIENDGTKRKLEQIQQLEL